VSQIRRQRQAEHTDEARLGAVHERVQQLAVERQLQVGRTRERQGLGLCSGGCGVGVDRGGGILVRAVLGLHRAVGSGILLGLCERDGTEGGSQKDDGSEAEHVRSPV